MNSSAQVSEDHRKLFLFPPFYSFFQLFRTLLFRLLAGLMLQFVLQATTFLLFRVKETREMKMRSVR